MQMVAWASCRCEWRCCWEVRQALGGGYLVAQRSGEPSPQAPRSFEQSPFPEYRRLACAFRFNARMPKQPWESRDDLEV